MTRRRWFVLVVGILIGILTARWFMWPPVDNTEVADAVVMFAGGRGERLPKAVELVENGVAPVLVIMNGSDERWPDANEKCSGESAYDVFCPTPNPDTTRGEAQTAAALAETRGWDSIVLVTSDYHIHRASLLLGRCFDGEIAEVPVGGDISVIARTRSVFHEWFGTLSAAIDRGC